MAPLTHRLLTAWASRVAAGRRAVRRPYLGMLQLEDRIAPAVFEVTNLNDIGPGSLRQAIIDANALPGPDVINFIVGPGTITLTTGELAISDAVTINGMGHTVSGNNTSRIFNTVTAPASTHIVINNMTLTAGTANSGGAVFASTQKLTLNDVTLRNNTASIDGGAIYFNNTGTLNLTRSTLHDNKSGFGGGVSFWSKGGTLNVTNSTLSGNLATNAGGAIYFWGSESGTGLRIRNSTIVGNTSKQINVGGGGIFLNTTLPFTIDSSIVSGNTSSTASDIHVDGATQPTVSFSAIGSPTGFTSAAGSSNNLPFGTNLKLLTLADNGGPGKTFAFEHDSPLRNAGSNPLGLTTDQRGLPRDNGGVDIGAFELNTLVTNVNDSGVGSLRSAVAETNRVNGIDLVTFAAGIVKGDTITLTSGEIAITDAVTIVGTGASISGDNASRIFNTLAAAAGTKIVINNLTLRDGSAVAGGGAVAASTQNLTFNDVTLRNNSAGGDGGAVHFNNAGTLNLNRSTLHDNTAATGGAVSMSSGGSLHIRNSTLSGNIATSFGGAILFTGSTSGDGLVIGNSTITNNSSVLGGGIVRSSTLPFEIVSTIVSGNMAGTGPDVQVGGGTQPTVVQSAIGSDSGWTIADGSGNLAPGIDLKLAPLADNGGKTFTHLPLAGSPVIDAGSNPFSLTTDQRGMKRAVEQTDIGAVEMPTTVSKFVINDGADQRSRVTKIDVHFTHNVSVAEYQTSSLIRIGPTGGTAGYEVNTSNGLIITQVNATTLRLSFANLANNGVEFGSLADGRWQFSAPASNFISNDAVPAERIRRLFGDADGNGTVDSTDFANFGNAFASSTNLAFDFDGNGTVDSTDFGFFGSRFGVSLG